ncbi:ribonuclease domain-containing protein [Corynebacterium halotolerans]|uniref:Guanyl-specific ribonuclease n=1 Tax=Corynebacterium halotolerans YIM 70093 = DSM 44683 TaxID=1121362 RepID=M1NZY4_9CORY|nr:ribonuclease domain-containing protein [Corynebacterium halotolerans]AGF73065.1 guanyl-specific ribonuclease [Corynebacterium halotolerans YIM 70093 = DSM 44683]
MSQSSAPRKRSLAAILGGILLAGVAAWFGLDTDGDPHQTAPVAGGVDTPPAPVVGAYPACELDSLPDQTDLVVDDILTGGPFTYPEKDGTRFGNYEGVLPDEQLGFYREYTVDTPGLSHRGERRIVTGGGTEADPEVWYYSDDHYESFCEIPDAED